MHTEPIAHKVGDSVVRIDDLADGIKADDDLEGIDPRSRRVYTFRVSKGDVTTVYRCRVLLADVIRKTDAELAEYLARKAHRKVRLFAFRGDAIP